MFTVNFTTLVKWCNEESDNAIKWHSEATKNVTDPKRLSDFRAGFHEGYWRAIKALQFHKAVAIDHKK